MKGGLLWLEKMVTHWKNQLSLSNKSRAFTSNMNVKDKLQKLWTISKVYVYHNDAKFIKDVNPTFLVLFI
jgi:hypothetical protein